MKVIGITGGVGAGKSDILDFLANNSNCRVLVADKLARQLECRGNVCYGPIVELLGEDILDEDKQIVPQKMAAAIFSDNNLLMEVDNIIHPAVKEKILEYISDEDKAGKIDYFFIEAALLIEDGYDLICDELWYIYTTEENRRIRLKESRGYSDEKIDSIMASQLDEETFRRYCSVVIDNNGTIEETKEQLKAILDKE